LLADMNRLYPAGEDNSNAFRYEFFFRLTTNIQALLGEDKSSSELAARADLLVAATAKSSTDPPLTPTKGGRRGSGRTQTEDPDEKGAATRTAKTAPSPWRSLGCAGRTLSTAAKPTRRAAARVAPGRKTKPPGVAQRRRRRDAGPCGVQANG
jgi:hypothetical protein